MHNGSEAHSPSGEQDLENLQGEFQGTTLLKYGLEGRPEIRVGMSPWLRGRTGLEKSQRSPLKSEHLAWAPLALVEGTYCYSLGSPTPSLPLRDQAPF